jgi:phage terminase large subunit-like protein
MGIQSLRKHKEWLETASIDTESLTLELENWQAKVASRLNAFSQDIARKFRTANCQSDLRILFRNDLFLLLATACQRYDMLNGWCVDRCAEVQADPYGHVDLWAREHYKSTIVTLGMTLFDIINSHGKGLPPETKPLTTGIFSYTRTIAKAFLRQIKLELERNQILKIVFDDIFYADPAADSPKWAENEGIIVRRDSNPKESTIEAWGLIDGQPTSKHFDRLVYDDIVTHDKVRTEYSRSQVITAWENSISLISVGGKSRYAGTRKHLTDVYSEIMARDAAKKRLYTPWANAEKTKGVLFSLEELTSRRRKMGEITWAAEYENDPMAASSFTLDYTKIVYDDTKNTANLNLYMICDSSTGKHKKTDYTAFLTLGIDWSGNIRLVDGVYDRITQSERFDALHHLYLRFPKIIHIFYEVTGLCEDIGYFKECMSREGHIFHQKIVEMHPTSNKQDRILKIEPYLTRQQLIFPYSLKKMSKRGQPYDIVQKLVYEEMKLFPYPRNDDGLDVLGSAIEKIQSGDMITPVQENETDLDKFYETQKLNPQILSTPGAYNNEY